MKTFYNKGIVSAAILAMLVSPSLVFAAEARPTKANGAAGFCTKIDSVAQNLAGRITKKDDMVGTKEKSRLLKLSEKRVVVDTKRSGNRNEGAVKHDEVYKKLTEKANTDAKKAAVTTFQTSISSAVSKRQAAVDAAVKTYRTGVDSLVSGKFTMLDANVTAFKTSVDAAIATAKSSCASGTSGEVVRKTMQDTIKAAQEKVKNSRTDTEIKTKLKTLLDARNASIKAAGDQFKIDTEAARTALKAAFAAQ